MFRHAAVALLIAGFIQAAAIPLRADEALPQTAEPIAFTVGGAEGNLSSNAVLHPGPAQIFAIALLVAMVASIPGRVR
jgi:hypothetical protein